MARSLNDSPYLYGLHDAGGEQVMARQGIQGWILFTEALGSDPGNRSAADYSGWSDQGFGIIVRLNNGYEPQGTIPAAAHYALFARRCANFVQGARGAHIWIIGNEMNHPVERPGVAFDTGSQPPRLVKPGEVISPSMYADCYRQCRDAIKRVPGHEKDQVITGAVAPWNTQTTYRGNTTGDWVKYLADMLSLLGPGNCDGIAVHAYTHGADPQLVYTDASMDPPFQNRQYNFRVYRDFLAAVPNSMRHLPVYLTETDQNDPWRNQNNGWVQRVYGEIDAWNRQPGTQVIRAVILYRWQNVDRWGIDGKAGVIEDLTAAMRYRYEWESAARAKPAPAKEPEKPAATPQPAPTAPPKAQADNAVISFGDTGKTAKGQFAAFHRRYGASITGAPISDEYVHPQTGLKTQEWQRLSMEEKEGVIGLRMVGVEAAALRLQSSRLQQQIEQLQEAAAGADDLRKRAEALSQLVQTLTHEKAAAVELVKTAEAEKAHLAEQLDAMTSEKSALAAEAADLQAAGEQLAQQVQTLTASVESLQQQLQAAADESQSLRKQIADLEERMAQLLSESNPAAPVTPLPEQPDRIEIQAPPITDLVDSLPKHATLRYDTRPLKNVTHIAIHHSAGPADVLPGPIAQYHVRQGWPGMGYHFYIRPDGTIFQTNRLETISYHTHQQNHLSIGVCLAGRFVDGAVPTARQIDQAGHLVAWLMQQLNIPLKNIMGHKEFPHNATTCPGTDWLAGKRWKDLLLARIHIVQSGLAEAGAPDARHILQDPAPAGGRFRTADV